MSTTNDFRAASGLKRWPADAEDLADDQPAPPRGPGLFAGRPGQRRDRHHQRPAAGRMRAGPGLSAGARRSRPGCSSCWRRAVRTSVSPRSTSTCSRSSGSRTPRPRSRRPSLDAGMTILTLLALGLALAGQSAGSSGSLIVVCAAAVGRSELRRGGRGSPRSVVAYVAAPLFLAARRRPGCVRDPPPCPRRADAVRVGAARPRRDRRWPGWPPWSCCTCCGSSWRRRRPARACAGSCSTRPRCRRPSRTALPAAEEVPAIEPPPVTEPPELAGASKKVRLAWWYERDDAYGDRKRTAEAAKRLAPKVDLSEGTARAYIGAILDGRGRPS